MPQEIFASTLQKTYLILNDIEQELEWIENKHQAFSLLRVVLQTLRDRLTVDEAVHFASQLPTMLRGVYYEGWKPSKVPIKFNKVEFIGEIESRFPSDPEISTEAMIRAVLKVLGRHIDIGELENVQNMLPKEFGEFFS